MDSPAVGDEVFSYCFPGGGYAEYVVVAAGATAAKPGSLAFIDAAAVPVAGLSAHQGVVDELELREGQAILITGPAGGVGSCAIQIAAAQGATVIAALLPPKEEVPPAQPQQVRDHLLDSQLHVCLKCYHPR